MTFPTSRSLWGHVLPVTMNCSLFIREESPLCVPKPPGTIKAKSDKDPTQKNLGTGSFSVRGLNVLSKAKAAAVETHTCSLCLQARYFNLHHTVSHTELTNDDTERDKTHLFIKLGMDPKNGKAKRFSNNPQSLKILLTAGSLISSFRVDP